MKKIGILTAFIFMATISVAQDISTLTRAQTQAGGEVLLNGEGLPYWNTRFLVEVIGPGEDHQDRLHRPSVALELMGHLTLDWLEGDIPYFYFELDTFQFLETEDHDDIQLLKGGGGPTMTVSRDIRLNQNFIIRAHLFELAGGVIWEADSQAHFLAEVAASLLGAQFIQREGLFDEVSGFEFTRLEAHLAAIFGDLDAARFEVDLRGRGNFAFSAVSNGGGESVSSLGHVLMQATFWANRFIHVYTQVQWNYDGTQYFGTDDPALSEQFFDYGRVQFGLGGRF